MYADGKIFWDDAPEGLSATWKYVPELNFPVEYASLYCLGKSLGEVCPEDKLDDWIATNNILRNYLRACETAKVDLEQNCFYDLVPEKFLLRYCELRSLITEHVLSTYPKPENYNFLTDLVKLLAKIKDQPLNIDSSALSSVMALPRARMLFKKISKRRHHRVHYDPFKSKTGRLTTHKTSFPILTLDKVFRSVVKPTNDYFVELDFNAAELRTLLALSGREQPAIDIHEWNAKNVYRGMPSREEAKKRIFAWLYNPDSNDYLSGRMYDRETVLRSHFDGTKVTTLFGRQIAADNHHALNYIIQSTTSDLLLKRAIETDKILHNQKSNIAFLMHDSLVIDFAKEDISLLDNIIEEFSNTELGAYVVNISVGRDFGAMKEYRR